MYIYYIYIYVCVCVCVFNGKSYTKNCRKFFANKLKQMHASKCWD